MDSQDWTGPRLILILDNRQATKEPFQEVPRYRQDQGPQEEQGLNVIANGRFLVIVLLVIMGGGLL